MNSPKFDDARGRKPDVPILDGLRKGLDGLLENADHDTLMRIEAMLAKKRNVSVLRKKIKKK